MVKIKAGTKKQMKHMIYCCICERNTPHIPHEDLKDRQVCIKCGTNTTKLHQNPLKHATGLLEEQDECQLPTNELVGL